MPAGGSKPVAPYGAWKALAELVRAGASGIADPTATPKARAFLSRHGYAKAQLAEGRAGGRRRWVWFVTGLGIEKHERLQAGL